MTSDRATSRMRNRASAVVHGAASAVHVVDPAADLVGLWNPDDADSVILSFGLIAAVVDLSGQHRHWVQPDPTHQPDPGTIGTAGAIVMDGAQFDNLYASAIDLPQPYTIYAAVQTSTPAAYGFVLGANNAVIYTTAGTWRAYAGAELIGSAVDTAPHVVACRFDGAASVLHVDGVQVAAGDVGNLNLSTFLSLGANEGGFGGNWTGAYGPHRIYSVGHDDATMSSIARQLMAAIGI